MKDIDLPVQAPIEKLALMCMVKAKHGNSILFHEAWYKMGAKLGIDGKTLKKYLTQCLADGLCTKETQYYNRHNSRFFYRFVSYKKAIQSLLGINEYDCRFFKIHKEANSFKQFQKLIEIDIAASFYSKQDYNVKSHFPDKNIIMKKIIDLNFYSVPGRKTRQQNAALGRLVRKLSTAEQTCTNSRLKGHRNCVVTGCNHIAPILKKSRTTAHKRLKEWSANGTIKLQQVVSLIPVQTVEGGYALLDHLYATKAKGIHYYSKKERGVKTIFGNRVLSFDSPKLKLGEAAIRTAKELTNA